MKARPGSGTDTHSRPLANGLSVPDPAVALAAIAVVCVACATTKLCAADAPPAAAARELRLENELPVSGPQVILKTTYGVHYHPGAALVLEGQVLWPGAEGAPIRSELAVQEGAGDEGPRYEAGLAPGPASGFRLPVRAPPGGATLRLTVRQECSGAAGDVFRTSLVKAFKVLPGRSRVVLKCGQAPLPAFSAPRDWCVAPVAGSEMPDADWMYENVDLVVLGQGAFSGFAPEAQAVLQRWVLGGGAVLIASHDAASQDVLTGAVRAGLTPLPPDTQETESSPEWWKTRAGLKEENLQRDARFQLVFARYKLGLGGGVLFFPFADPDAVTNEGAKALADPALARERPTRPDARVWDRAYELFAPGVIPTARRYRVGFSAAIGALCLLAVLAYASGERRRYMAAGLALGACALLAGLLARGFPTPGAVISRVEVTEVAADGRAARRRELAFVEGQGTSAEALVRGPADGRLLRVYRDEDELARDGTVLAVPDALALRMRIQPDSAAAVFEAERVLLPPHAGAPVGALTVWPGAAGAPAPADEGSMGGDARGSWAVLGKDAVAARRRALDYALEVAASRHSEVKVRFGELHWPAGEGPLVQVEGITQEEGAGLSIWLVE